MPLTAPRSCRYATVRASTPGAARIGRRTSSVQGTRRLVRSSVEGVVVAPPGTNSIHVYVAKTPTPR